MVGQPLQITGERTDPIAESPRSQRPRMFANTIKYVLMSASSNLGNMFSAAEASAFLSFLRMLPSQILLNTLLYDTSQLAIPPENVDEEQLRRPAHGSITPRSSNDTVRPRPPDRCG